MILIQRSDGRGAGRSNLRGSANLPPPRSLRPSANAAIRGCDTVCSRSAVEAEVSSSLIASYLPARQASLTDPARATRAE